MNKSINRKIWTLLTVAIILFIVPVDLFAEDRLIVKDSSSVTKFTIQIDDTTDAVRVGIDTQDPLAKLQISTVNPPDIGTPWDIYSYNSSFGRVGIDSGKNNAGLEFMESNVRKWFLGSFNGIFGVYNTPGMAFEMVITPSGNIGLGTTEPASKLAVVGLPSSPPDASGTRGVVCITNDGNMWVDDDGVCDCQ